METLGKGPILQIMGLLDPDDLENLRLVSKTFNEIAGEALYKKIVIALRNARKYRLPATDSPIRFQCQVYSGSTESLNLSGTASTKPIPGHTSFALLPERAYTVVPEWDDELGRPVKDTSFQYDRRHTDNSVEAAELLLPFRQLKHLTLQRFCVANWESFHVLLQIITTMSALEELGLSICPRGDGYDFLNEHALNIQDLRTRPTNSSRIKRLYLRIEYEFEKDIRDLVNESLEASRLSEVLQSLEPAWDQVQLVRWMPSPQNPAYPLQTEYEYLLSFPALSVLEMAKDGFIKGMGLDLTPETMEKIEEIRLYCDLDIDDREWPMLIKLLKSYRNVSVLDVTYPGVLSLRDLETLLETWQEKMLSLDILGSCPSLRVMKWRVSQLCRRIAPGRKASERFGVTRILGFEISAEDSDDSDDEVLEPVDLFEDTIQGQDGNFYAPTDAGVQNELKRNDSGLETTFERDIDQSLEWTLEGEGVVTKLPENSFWIGALGGDE